jgi:hypothetical protein
LFVLKIVQVPEFHRDAQYYVQAALLWPSGRTTFAASWIGSRDLVPLTYFGAIQTFGASLDAIAIVLAAIYALFCLVLSLAIGRLVESRGASMLLILLTWVGAFPLRTWLHPGSEGMGALLEAAILASFVWAYRHHRAWVPAISLGFAIALCLQVRSELVILGCLVAQRILFAKGVGDRTIRSGVGFAMCLGAALFVASLLAHQTWSMWIPNGKPYVYRDTFLAYRAVNDFGYGANGPASKRLAELVGVRDDEKLPFWKALGWSYRVWGAAESDSVMGTAAIEAVRRFSGEMLRSTGAALCGEFCGSPKPRTLFTISDTTCDERWERQRVALRKFDHLRTSTSEQFGGDATARTEALAERKVPWVAALREWICVPALHFSPPFVLATVPSVVLILLATVVTGLPRDLSLSLGLYGIALQVLVGVTQGPVARYAEATMLIQIVVLLAIGAQVIEKHYLQSRLGVILSSHSHRRDPPKGAPGPGPSSPPSSKI